MSKPALIFFFTARVHTRKPTIKILAVPFVDSAEEAAVGSFPTVD
jgi:hypothetical protein